MKVKLIVPVLCLSLITGGRAEESSSSAPPDKPSLGGEKREDEVSRLEGQLAAARLRLKADGLDRRDTGYIETLEKKALAFEASRSALTTKEDELNRLRSSVAELDQLRETLNAQMQELVSSTNRLTMKIKSMEEDQKPLQDALDLIRKGKYEYYEVKEGDTCESIAQQATIYNDGTKHVLIRQANRDKNRDLDKLVPGEVLVIPRFSMGGSYEF